MTRNVIPVFMAINLFVTVGSIAQNTPPLPPAITEPVIDLQVVNASDVHMEAGPFIDPDAGDTHVCSDWEIWTVSPSGRIWITTCIGGVEKLHTHFGDGAFEGSHAGRTELFPDMDYRLRVRFRDSSGDPLTEWSLWSERLFRTGALTQLFPLDLEDIASSPTPQWNNETSGLPVVLPVGSPQPSLRIETPPSNLLLSIQGLNGISNTLQNPPALADHKHIRVVLNGGSSGMVLSQTRLVFTDDAGVDREIFLPAMNLVAGSDRYLWISSNGSSYEGNAGQSEPDFTTLAQGAPVPWAVRQAGFKVEKVSSGFQLPVNIAFVPNPGSQPMDPYFYVTELYGIIKVVTRNGTVLDYATNLLNFNPTGNFPGSGEQGLSGILVEPGSGDIIASMLYDASPPNGPHYPKVVRFTSINGGLNAGAQTTILDMPGETQGQSHFISNLSIGPDGKLYVHMGDGFTSSTALNINSFRGKILRVNLDGSAPTDNPFYNAGDGINAKDYIFTYGLRNPFGGAWRLSDGYHYEVENGPSHNDRIARMISGGNYGWDGTDASMTISAIYNWDPPHGPVNMAFPQSRIFSGSGFPLSKLDHMYITESGPTYATGPQAKGKRIVEFEVSPGGTLISGPAPLVEYNGSGKGTAVALTAGPDGLYFSDFYKDLNYTSPVDRGANILRVKFIGTADFAANATSGLAPLSVQFTDLSNVPSASAWFWDFGDGGTSTLQSPNHTYTTDGLFNVRLTVTGTNGPATVQKNAYIIIGNLGAGLRGEYYDNIDLTGTVLTRIDPVLDFNWGTGSPDPSMGSDDFSVRWSGRVKPEFTETFFFYTHTDDGVRLWVNNQLLVDQWIDQSPTEHSGTIALAANTEYDIRMEYYERGGGAVARLSWSAPSQIKQVIPQSRLYPTTTAYQITSTNGANGVVSPAGVINVSQGATQVFTITPATGHQIDSVVVDGVLQAPQSSYSFTNVNANHSIYVSFKPNIFTITAVPGVNGTLDPSGDLSLPFGTNQTFTITPDQGYHVDSVVVDGVDQGSVPSYTFNSISSNHSIAAYFGKTSVRLAMKAFLEGGYLGGSQMRTTLRSAGYLATRFPGKSIPAMAVDSISLEIRDAQTPGASTIRRFAPVWLLSDGSVRSMLDTSQAFVEFDSTVAGSYYIVLRHRNHLSVMSANPVPLLATIPLAYDFSSSSSQAFGANATKNLGGGIFGLYAGDGSADGFIDSDDFAGPDNSMFLSGYLDADYTLDGFIDSDDFVAPDNNAFTGSNVPN